jgi:hypothetical protein
LKKENFYIINSATVHGFPAKSGTESGIQSNNSNDGFHPAGPWGLFLRAANDCFILLNGSIALKFVIAQPQRRLSPATDAFSACSEPLFKATGALDKLW